jgi:hypothetical protein
VIRVDFDLDKLRDIPDPYDASVATPAPVVVPPATSGLSRSSVRARRGLIIGLSLCVVTLTALRMGIAPRSEGAAFFALALALPALGGLLALFAAWSPGPRGLGLRTGQLALSAAVASALFVASTQAEYLGAAHPRTMHGTLGCGAVSVVLAAIPLFAGFLAFRRGLGGNVALRMLCFGVGSGVLGAVLLRVHCVNDGAAHVLLGHGAAIVFGAVAGALVGRVSARL